jgi:hypothetical protein
MLNLPGFDSGWLGAELSNSPLGYCRPDQRDFQFASVNMVANLAACIASFVTARMKISSQSTLAYRYVIATQKCLVAGLSSKLILRVQLEIDACEE